jgi:hypothetical protein
MAASSRFDRRRRVARGIYQQGNGRYAVCVMVDGQPRCHTLSAATISEARRQREPLQSVARIGELPVSPRLTFAEVAERWLADFEVKVAAGERRERTFDLYRSQRNRHLLPKLGRRRLRLITADDVVALMRKLQADGLSPWTIKRILGALSCVFAFPELLGACRRRPRSEGLREASARRRHGRGRRGEESVRSASARTRRAEAAHQNASRPQHPRRTCGHHGRQRVAPDDPTVKAAPKDEFFEVTY